MVYLSRWEVNSLQSSSTLLVLKPETLLHKEVSMKERYNTSTVFKQNKQLIFTLKFHADIAAIFSQMGKIYNTMLPSA